MSRSMMPTFRDHLKQELSGPIPPALWAASTFLLALSGPLGSMENCTFAHRVLFWSLTIGSIMLLSGLFRAFLHGVLGLQHLMRDLPIVAGLVATLLVVPLSAVAQSDVIEAGGVIDARPSEILVFLFMVSMVVGAYSYLSRTTGATPATAPDATPDTPLATGPRLLQRLDPALQGDILAITGRDHYVDILTRKGKASILMRFSDAMAEAAPTDGAQVHRSHWVAWSAVKAVERSGDRMLLVLSDAAKIPVSRSYRDLVARRGLTA